MSMLALLTAVRDQIREPTTTSPAPGLGVPSAECQVMFDGMPMVSQAWDYFVAVHEASWTSIDIEGFEEVYAVDVTVTIRVTKVPMSNFGPYGLIGPDMAASLLGKTEAIRALLHMDRNGYPVLHRANAIINNPNPENGFVEPLRFLSADKAEVRGVEWFSTEIDSKTRTAPVGLSKTLHFGHAKRIQVIENQT